MHRECDPESRDNLPHRMPGNYGIMIIYCALFSIPMYFDEKTKGYLTHENLRLLFRLRNIAISAQSAAILLAVAYLHMALPVWSLISVVAGLSVFNIYTRYRINQPRPLQLYELVTQLIVDILALTILLSLSGGASNPFAILYLLPLTITAILLPARVTWGIALFTVLCYSSLLVIYIPMPHAHNQMDAFNLHIVGMWLGFVLSAGVVAYFIVGLQKIIRSQADALNRAKEEAIRNEQLVKLGVLSASVAHDLGTPLNAMALLLEDIEYEDAKASPSVLDKTALLKQQIERCRNALTTLSSSAGNVNLKSGQKMLLSDYLNQQLSHWKQSHPHTDIKLNIQHDDHPLTIMTDEVLNLALTNIIDNAAEVSPQRIELNVLNHEQDWDLFVRDYGPGLTADVKSQLGDKIFSSKPNGLGLGLFLSHAVIERLGGMVKLYNHDAGGLCTHVQLPANFKQVAA